MSKITINLPWKPIFAVTETISLELARKIGDEMGVDWKFVDLKEFRNGIEVELEHGSKFVGTNLISDELHLSAMIALAHLKESRIFLHEK